MRRNPNDCSLRRRFLSGSDENGVYYLVVPLVILAPEQIEMEINNGNRCGKILLFAERSSSCRVLLAMRSLPCGALLAEGSSPRREQFTIRFAGTLSCCALFVSPKMIRFALKMLAELAVPH